MTIDAPSRLVPPVPQSRGITRRGVLKTGLGLAGAGAIIVPGTTAYAAMEAANSTRSSAPRR